MDRFDVKIEYYFYPDKRGKQRFYYKSEKNLNSKITLRNRLAVIIDTIQLVWSLK